MASLSNRPTNVEHLVIEALAQSEAALFVELLETRAERDAHALVARCAVHALHDRWVAQQRVEARLRRVLDENRRLRASMLRGEQVAA